MYLKGFKEGDRSPNKSLKVIERFKPKKNLKVRAGLEPHLG